ncbi:MAG: trypsin-like serine protease [Candidatus Methylacidiphilales bacterium]
MRIKQGLLLMALFSQAYSASALILLNQGNSDTSITTDPGTGVPWKNVAQVMLGANPGGSAVYLGNQYILTADHVSHGGSFVIDGQSFTVDSTFNTGGYTNGVQQIAGADLKMVRLSSDPGLVVSGLASINLNSHTVRDRSRDVVLIGYGQGRGSEVAGQGWNWGTGTEDQRWGTNTTLSSTQNVTDGIRTTEALRTQFDNNAINTEAALTLNDSGGAMFYLFGGQWYLSGIAFAVSNSGSSFYDRDLVMSGDQPDTNFFARISAYHSQISTALAVIPEPSSSSLLVIAAAAMLWRRRYQSLR